MNENKKDETTQAEPKHDKRLSRHVYYRGSIIFPIIIVAIGIIFLLKNLGVVTGDIWGLILSLWPILLIAIGLDGLIGRSGLASSIFWIALGTIFLLSNFGVLGWSVWQVVLTVWPILLVAWGLDIIVGRRSALAAVVSMLVLLVITAGALWFLSGGFQGGRIPNSQSINQDLNGATQATLVLSPAAGLINIDALTSGSNSIAQGSIQPLGSENISRDYKVVNSIGTLTLRSQGGTIFYPIPRLLQWTWDLGLNPKIPLDMSANLGAGKLNLDLDNLEISGLDAEIGVGQIVVTLPVSGHFEATIKGAVGEMDIVVPKGMEVRIKSSTGIATVNAPKDYQHQDNVYTSPGYSSSNNRVDLSVDQAIGLIQVREGE